MTAPDPARTRVADIMTTAVLTVDLETVIFDAVEQMVFKKVGALVVTERDLQRRVIMGGLQPRHETVRQMYTPALVSIAPDATVQEMCRKMHAGHFRHLPVMENGELKGLVSARDLIRFIAGE